MYEERRYKISEFAAMTGMTPSKVRFYEKAGLFTTHKEENGYRFFTPYDAFRANAFRVLLQYGFTVEKAIAMLDARQESAEFEDALVAQRAHLLEQADLLRYRLARIDEALELLNPQPGSGFALVDIEDHVYARASFGTDFSVSVENEHEIAAFYDLLSVSNCARIISMEDFARPGATVDPNYVIAMPESELRRLVGVAGVDQARVGRLVLGKCLRYRRRLTREESLLKASYDEMFAWLDEHGYRLRGDILLLPAFMNLDGVGDDIETLYMPIG